MAIKKGCKKCIGNLASQLFPLLMLTSAEAESYGQTSTVRGVLSFLLPACFASLTNPPSVFFHPVIMFAVCYFLWGFNGGGIEVDNLASEASVQLSGGSCAPCSSCVYVPPPPPPMGVVSNVRPPRDVRADEEGRVRVVIKGAV